MGVMGKVERFEWIGRCKDIGSKMGQVRLEPITLAHCVLNYLGHWR